MPNTLWICTDQPSNLQEGGFKRNLGNILNYELHWVKWHAAVSCSRVIHLVIHGSFQHDDRCNTILDINMDVTAHHTGCDLYSWMSIACFWYNELERNTRTHTGESNLILIPSVWIHTGCECTKTTLKIKIHGPNEAPHPVWVLENGPCTWLNINVVCVHSLRCDRATRTWYSASAYGHL